MSADPCFWLVTQSCPTLCDPMNCSMPVFPVLHYLPEFAQTHVHWVSDAIKSFHPLPFSSFAFNLSQHQDFFPVSWLFASGGQNIGVSASASVLPMSVQGWFPLGLVWSLCSSRDSQESSPAPQFESISSSVLSLLYGPILTSVHDYWKNHSFDYMDLSSLRFPLRVPPKFASDAAILNLIFIFWQDSLFLQEKLAFAYFVFWLCGMENLNSLTRDWTHVFCSGSVAS